MQIQIKAYAKINLALDILGTRDDGYHTVSMIMQSVSLADTVSIRLEKYEKITLFMSSHHAPPPRFNTAYKAAELFFETANMKNPGVSIRIQKRIPMGAGLAGGSADAAAVIEGLNQMFKANLTIEGKNKLAAAIGADVPFCLTGGTMLAEGTGTDLVPLPPLPEPCWFVLCKPSLHVSTAVAYNAYDEYVRQNPAREASGDCARPSIIRTKKAIETGSFPELAASLGNVFETALQFPVVGEIKRLLLENGAAGACMSGSGSTVYGIFSERQQAKACADLLSQKYKDVFVCTPMKKGLGAF